MKSVRLSRPSFPSRTGLAVFNVKTLIEHVAAHSTSSDGEPAPVFFRILALARPRLGSTEWWLIHCATHARVGIAGPGGAKERCLKLILVKGLVLVAWGTGFGLIGCYWLSSLVSTQLYGVSPNDPATLAAVAGLLIAVALLASYLPARRATKVDPLVALRYE